MLPGNNKIGTLKWKCRYYVFSSVDRAEQFGSEPDLYIQVKLIKTTAEILFFIDYENKKNIYSQPDQSVNHRTENKNLDLAQLF